MDTKIALGILVAAGIGIGGYFYSHSVVPAPAVVTTDIAGIAPVAPQLSKPSSITGLKPSMANTSPTIKIGSTTITMVPASATFDASTFTSTSTNPSFSGTANIPKVGIILYNGAGEGVLGTKDISVVNGRWTYAVSVALEPGNYTLLLLGGAKPVNAKLIVQKP